MGEIRQTSFNLSPNELTIHFIASGLVHSAEQTLRGKRIEYPYPIALQRGLNRLVLACIQRGISAVQGVPDLLDWCRRPIHSWGLDLNLEEIGLTDTLL